MVLECRAKHYRVGRLRTVKLLEKAASKCAVINYRWIENQTVLGNPINSAAPHITPERVIMFGMFLNQKCFGFPIAGLLPQIGTDGRTAIMPNKTARRESQPIAPFLQSPAYIHIIASVAKDGIETVNLLKCPFVKGHITTRNMFRLFVRQHHVGGPSGRNQYHRSHRRVLWRKKIMSSHPHVIILNE